VVEIRRREKIAVIRHGYRRHAPARRFGSQFADFTSAVEQGVIGVEM